MATSSPVIERRVHHRRSAQSLAVGLGSRLILKNTVRAWTALPDLRWPFDTVDRFAGLLPHRSSARVERVRLPRCRAEWVRPRDTVSPRRAVLYLHGGGFLTCGLNTHRALVTRLATSAEAGVLNVAYRMLPAHRIADAVEDGLSGLRWLLRQGYAGDGIVVAGDSAGGFLAFLTTLAALRGELVTPAGIAVISPLTDANPAAKLGHRNARRCAMFPTAALSILARYLRHPQVTSPVDADLSALPPVTIHASCDELLLADAELMAQRLRAAGVACDLHLWQGQIHDFPLAADVLPEGRQAIRYLGEFIRTVTAHPQGDGRAA